MNCMNSFFSLCVALLLLHVDASGAFAESNDWALEHEKDGVTVYTREVEGSDYKAFKGETVIDVELNRALALMDDTAACVDWMHSCKSPVLIRKLTPLKRYTYMVNDFPWPAKDRALLLSATISQEMRSRVVTVALENVELESLEPSDKARVPLDNGAVLMERAEGFFRFTPLGGNRTHVEYQMHIEPGGALPASIVNAKLIDTPFNTLRAMQSVVTEEKYTDFRPF